MDKVLAVEKYRAQYISYLKDYVEPANKLFLFSEYKTKFDQLFALYGNKTTNDTQVTVCVLSDILRARPEGRIGLSQVLCAACQHGSTTWRDP